MNPETIIRDETDADIAAIAEVTIAGFKTLEISNQTEQSIVKALRAAKALTVSLVAEADGLVVGHIAFSPVTISDGTVGWHGLGPVSVLPEYQRKGIGKALVLEGLSRLRNLNARGCCLVGHPAYYKKFGFKNMPGLVCEGAPPEVFLALAFDGHARRALSCSTKDSRRIDEGLVERNLVTPAHLEGARCSTAPRSDGVRRA
jgi:putative acetyltransferase